MEKQKRKIDKFSVFIAALFLIGLSLVLYPTIANYVNSLSATKAIAEYKNVVSETTNSELERIKEEVQAYNDTLVGQSVERFSPSEEEHETYMNLLDITGTGLMGYISIPKIDVDLPIFHTTDEEVLAHAVGHIEGSSLPVPTLSSHVLLSGHRGLPSATLFTYLDKLEEGDYFLLYVLDETYAYKVDQIRIVDPADLSNLEIENGKSYCTLITCTPYSINSHRLLIRGHQVDLSEVDEVTVTADLSLLNTNYLVIAIFVLLLALLLAASSFISARRQKEKKQ
jgi:sortase A